MKKVFITIFAALMLFAFTACDGGNSSLDMIYSVTAEAADTVYLPGETVDPSEFTYTVIYSDNRVGTATAADFVWQNLVVDDDGTFNAVGSYAGNASWTVSVPVNVATVDSITVDAANINDTPLYATNSAEAKYTNDTIDLTGLKITAKYTFDGVTDEREVSVDNKYVSASIDDWKTAVETDVKVEYCTQSATYKTTLLDNFIESFAMKTTDDYKVYLSAHTTTAGKLAYATNVGVDGKETAGVYMEATYNNGEKKAVAATELLFADNTGAYTISGTGSDYFANYTLPTSDGVVSVAAKYNGKLMAEGTELVAKAVEVPVVKDKIVDLAFVETSVLKTDEITIERADYSEGSTSPITADVYAVFASDPAVEDADDVTTELTYKATSGNSYTVSAEGGLDFTADTYSDNERIELTINVNATGYEAFTKTITVQLVAGA